MKRTIGFAIAAVIAALARPGRAQDVVATDENMGIQAVEITNWNMGASTSWSAFPAPAFDCAKLASVAVAIHSDIVSNGRPDVYSMDKSNRLAKVSTEMGGHSEIQCFNDNPSWLEIYLKFSPDDPSSIFRNPAFGPFNSTARRGWIKLEYWK